MPTQAMSRSGPDRNGPTKGDAIIALARDLRRAVVTREETMHEALDRYNLGATARLDYAAEFIKVVQKADTVYEETTREALSKYRERLAQC
jgi:hypothetical protein